MNLYATLEIPHTATREEIIAAYKRLVLQYHPNVTAGDSTKFIELAHAFRILKDEKQRFHYDMFGERALTYLNDNRFGEIIVNLYDRTNVVMFLHAAFFLLMFLFAFPYLLLFQRVTYFAIFSPFFVAVLIALIPLGRMARFFGKNTQYKSERSIFVFTSLKLLLFSLQVLAITLYYDLSWKQPFVYVLPALLLENVSTYHAFLAAAPPQRTPKWFLRVLVHCIVEITLIYGLISNIFFPIKCCIPTAFVAHWMLTKNIPLIAIIPALVPVSLLSLGVGIFLTRKFLLLGFISIILFDAILVIGLCIVLVAYKSISIHPRKNRSLVHI
jgi:hypothetical protein